MKRQAIKISIEELENLTLDLLNQSIEFPANKKQKWIVNIINEEKTPEGEYCSDTWEIEK